MSMTPGGKDGANILYIKPENKQSNNYLEEMNSLPCITP